MCSSDLPFPFICPLPFLVAYSASASLPPAIIKRCERAGADLVVCSPYQTSSLMERVQIVSPPPCMPVSDGQLSAPPPLVLLLPAPPPLPFALFEPGAGQPPP